MSSTDEQEIPRALACAPRAAEAGEVPVGAVTHKKRSARPLFLWMAEREGFEPPDPRGSTVFKTAAFDRSATSPRFGKQPLTKPS